MKSDSDPGARSPTPATPATDTISPRSRPNPAASGGAGSRSAADADKRTKLCECLDREHDGILKHLRNVIASAGFPRHEADTESLAYELLGAVGVEVLASASNFDTNRAPFPWIRGICVNVVRRRLAEVIGDNIHLIHIGSFSSSSTGPQSDVELSSDEVFDMLRAYSAHLRSDSADSGDPYTLVSASESRAENAAFVQALFARLDPADSEVLTLMVNNGMDRTIVAEKLGISRPATYQRYYRALDRARAVAGEMADTRRVIEYRKDQNR